MFAGLSRGRGISLILETSEDKLDTKGGLQKDRVFPLDGAPIFFLDILRIKGWRAGVGLSSCDGLDACVPPNSYAETLIPKCWHLEVGLWEAIRS